VTFLFTDIEGSTHRSESNADAMRAALITTAITHLRDVLGDETYESLARIGEAMTIAAIATYAYDQIDQARKELEQTP
jgi:hypothetical protein